MRTYAVADIHGRHDLLMKALMSGLLGPWKCALIERPAGLRMANVTPLRIVKTEAEFDAGIPRRMEKIKPKKEKASGA